MSNEVPTIAIAICTRNRPNDIMECVRSLLANPGQFTLIVIDQSDDPVQLDRISGFADDRRLLYLSSSTRGLSLARNLALEMCGSDLLAFTDDDCRVSPQWVEAIQRVFADEPELVLGFGRVVAPKELWEIGFVATFEPAGEIRYKGRLPRPMEPWGIGANMVLRPAVAIRVGSFDPFLGAGTPMHGGEELDLAMRVLGAGHSVACTNLFEVVHLGVRPHAIAGAQFRNYALGAGAAFAKNFRLGTPGARAFFISTIAMQVKSAVSAVLCGRRPQGLGMTLAILKGAARSFRFRLNAGSHSFENR